MVQKKFCENFEGKFWKRRRNRDEILEKVSRTFGEMFKNIWLKLKKISSRRSF